MSKKTKMAWNAGLIVALLATLFILEQVMPSGSMFLTVLKKGAIYALVAVSMNLLNGFTGLFSLGQAGFMLLGAYAYAILTIPVESRGSVYQYFDGGIVQFTVPVPVALIAGGLLAAVFAYLTGLPVLRLKSDYLAIGTLGFADIIRSVYQWDKLGLVPKTFIFTQTFLSFNQVVIPFMDPVL